MVSWFALPVYDGARHDAVIPVPFWFDVNVTDSGALGSGRNTVSVMVSEDEACQIVWVSPVKTFVTVIVSVTAMVATV